MSKEHEHELDVVHYVCKRCSFHYDAMPIARQVRCPAGHEMKRGERPEQSPEEVSCRAV